MRLWEWARLRYDKEIAVIFKKLVYPQFSHRKYQFWNYRLASTLHGTNRQRCIVYSVDNLTTQRIYLFRLYWVVLWHGIIISYWKLVCVQTQNFHIKIHSQNVYGETGNFFYLRCVEMRAERIRNGCAEIHALASAYFAQEVNENSTFIAILKYRVYDFLCVTNKRMAKHCK